jgi:tRNA threonylcarbamoyladenosine biosynthesis protein TsaE
MPRDGSAVVLLDRDRLSGTAARDDAAEEEGHRIFGDGMVRMDRDGASTRRRQCDVCIHSHRCRSGESCKSSHLVNGTETHVSNLPVETETLAAGLASRLRPGDVVTVSGELGTGKTTFVRGASRALGVEGHVTSPTFTIGHRYQGRNVDVSHLDLYRFRGLSAAEWGDLEPYFDDAIVFVEWPEAGAGVLPPPRFAVRIEHRGGDARIVSIRDVDPRVRHGD